MRGIATVKKTILRKTVLAMLLMASTSAMAGTYQFAQTKLDTCRDLGDYAANFYLLREQGEPKPLNKYIKDGTRMALIFNYVIDYAWGGATSRQNARSHVWAKCMDNFDWMVESDGTAPPDRLPY